ncbi:helix-turn-helix domain-containing protein [Rhodothermus marinus]|uniref:helix-turn-helix domain-containing protein n=1 Tax=Rhodothermus marinus TaxID=29549 RepID=UPI0037C7DB8E
MRLSDILALDRREMEEALRRVLREELPKILPEALLRAQRPFVDARELAERLGVSVRTIRSWQYSGRIPYVRAGRRVLFDVAAVEAALREGEVAAKWTTE